MKTIKIFVLFALLAVFSWSCKEEETPIPDHTLSAQGSYLAVRYYTVLDTVSVFDTMYVNVVRVDDTKLKISQADLMEFTATVGDKTSTGFTFEIPQQSVQGKTIVGDVLKIGNPYHGFFLNAKDNTQLDEIFFNVKIGGRLHKYNLKKK